MTFFGSLFGVRHQDKTSSIGTVLAMVTSAANLVSNPDTIDPILDKVRIITANLGPKQAPSVEDIEALFDVYLQIEAYLTTKEPIRTFTVEELRAHLAPELRRQLEEYETMVRQASAQ
jgi:hypothetical protein